VMEKVELENKNQKIKINEIPISFPPIEKLIFDSINHAHSNKMDEKEHSFKQLVLFEQFPEYVDLLIKKKEAGLKDFQDFIQKCNKDSDITKDLLKTSQDLIKEINTLKSIQDGSCKPSIDQFKELLPFIGVFGHSYQLDLLFIDSFYLINAPFAYPVQVRPFSRDHLLDNLIKPPQKDQKIYIFGTVVHNCSKIPSIVDISLFSFFDQYASLGFMAKFEQIEKLTYQIVTVKDECWGEHLWLNPIPHQTEILFKDKVFINHHYKVEGMMERDTKRHHCDLIEVKNCISHILANETTYQTKQFFFF